MAGDERHVVRLAEVNLQRAGYEVLVAYCSAEAIRVAREERPDLIVIDPGLSEAVETLRADPITQGIRMIVLGATPLDLKPLWR